MSLNDLKIEVNRMSEAFPDKAEEIQGLYQLCLDEIEQGESKEHEIELCIESINQLFEEDES